MNWENIKGWLWGIGILGAGLFFWNPFKTTEPQTTSGFVQDGTSELIRNDDPTTTRGGSDKDCGDFSSHSEAQDFFESNNPDSDPHNLDRDGDGYACETL